MARSPTRSTLGFASSADQWYESGTRDAARLLEEGGNMAKRVGNPDDIARKVFLWTVLYAGFFAGTVYYVMFRGA